MHVELALQVAATLMVSAVDDGWGKHWYTQVIVVSCRMYTTPALLGTLTVSNAVMRTCAYT